MSFFIERFNLQSLFYESGKMLERDIAQSLIKQDSVLGENQAISLALITKADNIRIDLFGKDKNFVVYPFEMLEKNCFFFVDKPISYYGANVGSISACFTFKNISKKVILSPTLLFSFVLFVFIAVFFSSLRLKEYKRRLFETIEALEAWDKSLEEDLEKKEIKSKDPLVQKILTLVFNGVSRKLELQKMTEEIDRSRKLSALASQVSHDIRSPLAALDMAIKDIGELPEETRLIIRHSVFRIRDIANNLLAKNRNQNKGADSSSASEQKIETVLLSSLIESLVSEKRMQFRSKLGVQINFDLNQESYGLFAKIETRELKRILSNLINNAVESFDADGEIKVILKTKDGKIEIQVKDNGKGIPPEVLVKLGQKGESFGKKEGNGLGLYHARTTLESWGGGLKFESTLGVGTTITVTLSKDSAPTWFVKELKFTAGSRVVIIDDDSSIHQIWDGRFLSAQFGQQQIEVVHLSNPAVAKEWYEENKGKKETQFLVDYEFLGSDSNGLKLIKELGIEKEAKLVTSRYEEEHILKKCLEDNISLIPKNLSAFIPIQALVTPEYFEYVYIEDDMLLRMGWERVAKRKKIKLLTLESPRMFHAHLDKINPETTKIYIDSSLGENEMKGEDFAQQLHDQGHKNLFIATGYEKEKFAHLPWLHHSGKDCPFDDEE